MKKQLAYALALWTMLLLGLSLESPAKDTPEKKVPKRPVQAQKRPPHFPGLKMMKELIGKGYDVNARSREGDTPLVVATAMGDLAVAKLLLEKKADPNIANRQGISSLLVAVAKRDTAMTQLLLDHDANVNYAEPRAGATPLMTACANGDQRTAAVLLAKGAEVNAKSKDGTTSLILAAGTPRAGLVKLLCEKGARVNGATAGGFTPLMVAAEAGYADVVKVLVEKGADINARTPTGTTALMMARNNSGNTRAVKLLLDKGASVDLKAKGPALPNPFLRYGGSRYSPPPSTQTPSTPSTSYQSGSRGNSSILGTITGILNQLPSVGDLIRHRPQPVGPYPLDFEGDEDFDDIPDYELSEEQPDIPPQQETYQPPPPETGPTISKEEARRRACERYPGLEYVNGRCRRKRKAKPHQRRTSVTATRAPEEPQGRITVDNSDQGRTYASSPKRTTVTTSQQRVSTSTTLVRTTTRTTTPKTKVSSRDRSNKAVRTNKQNPPSYSYQLVRGFPHDDPYERCLRNCRGSFSIGGTLESLATEGGKLLTDLTTNFAETVVEGTKDTPIVGGLIQGTSDLLSFGLTAKGMSAVMDPCAAYCRGVGSGDSLPFPEMPVEGGFLPPIGPVLPGGWPSMPEIAEQATDIYQHWEEEMGNWVQEVDKFRDEKIVEDCYDGWYCPGAKEGEAVFKTSRNEKDECNDTCRAVEGKNCEPICGSHRGLCFLVCRGKDNIGPVGGTITVDSQGSVSGGTPEPGPYQGGGQTQGEGQIVLQKHPDPDSAAQPIGDAPQYQGPISQVPEGSIPTTTNGDSNPNHGLTQSQEQFLSELTKWNEEFDREAEILAGPFSDFQQSLLGTLMGGVPKAGKLYSWWEAVDALTTEGGNKEDTEKRMRDILGIQPYTSVIATAIDGVILVAIAAQFGDESAKRINTLYETWNDLARKNGFDSFSQALRVDQILKRPGNEGMLVEEAKAIADQEEEQERLNRDIGAAL